MQLAKLYNPENGQMRVVGLMSGSGTNLRKIIEREREVEYEDGECPYKVVAIFTDNPQSNAGQIGSEYGILVVVNDANKFYSRRNKPMTDMDVRQEFDYETVNALSSFEATVAAYAGYMLKATEVLVDAFLGVNVHPADLSILNPDGTRKYVGDHAVRDAILAGEKYIRSTTHIVEPKVDAGRILMVSRPVEVVLDGSFDPGNKDLVDRVASEHQDQLKKVGDWSIFPLTLLNMAEGLHAKNADEKLYFKGKPIPCGIDPFGEIIANYME